MFTVKLDDIGEAFYYISTMTGKACVKVGRISGYEIFKIKGKIVVFAILDKEKIPMSCVSKNREYLELVAKKMNIGGKEFDEFILYLNFLIRIQKEKERI